jgi:putative Holliday junction resolvase
VLLAADVSRARRKEVIDKMAAAVILQRWLDANRSKTEENTEETTEETP